MLGERQGDRHHLVSDLPAAALADFVDHAGGIHAGDVRRLRLGGVVAAGSKTEIRRADGDRPHPDPDLLGTGMGFGKVMNTESLRPSKLDNANCSHELVSNLV
ncbi:MAG TPA: hypothetical protein VNB91_08910 [Jatrophihabitantaceae bacterium]|nr:hypothetical protein [Jatrophihabitantaceae bacterium]